MTAQDLRAAQQRVEQRAAELRQAQTALRTTEHGEYRDALRLIAKAVEQAPLTRDTNGIKPNAEALDAISVVLQGIGFLTDEGLATE